MATTNNENKVSYITASDGLKYRINDNNAVHDSSEISFSYTDEEKWKLPMVDYVNENIKFSNLSNNDFKAPMTTYVNANLDFDSMPQQFKDKMIQYFKDNISYILGFDDNTGSILMTDK